MQQTVGGEGGEALLASRGNVLREHGSGGTASILKRGECHWGVDYKREKDKLPRPEGG